MHNSYEREKSVEKKWERFCEEIDKKRKKDQPTSLSTDKKIYQNEIKIIMFNAFSNGGKAYVAEQKIREFKNISLKIKQIHRQ